jgi:hypothetical protein
MRELVPFLQLALCVWSLQHVTKADDATNAIDSDYLHLYTAPSSIGVGLGVFARSDIPEGSILCEYRGEEISLL